MSFDVDMVVSGGELTAEMATTSSVESVELDGTTVVTSVTWANVTNKPDTFPPESHTHTVSDITDFPTIPTKTSELTNDSGFLTQHQSLIAYRTSENQDLIDNAIKSRVTTLENGLVASISSGSTDAQYPSAKCVYNLIGNIETLLEGLL